MGAWVGGVVGAKVVAAAGVPALAAFCPPPVMAAAAPTAMDMDMAPHARQPAQQQQVPSRHARWQK